MNIVIFTGGEFTKSSLTKKVLRNADMVIAADSGAEHALKNDMYPTAVLGDLDSISKKTKHILQKHGTQFVNLPTTLLSRPLDYKNSNTSEKDQTDTELAVQYAIQLGAKKITLLGGNAGDRFDHVMANILLSAVVAVPLFFVHGNQVSWIEKGPTVVKLSGEKGDLLSLIPIVGNVEGIVSKNLQYALTKETLLFGMPRGVSNVFLEARAEVSFARGMLLFVQTYTHF